MTNDDVRAQLQELLALINDDGSLTTFADHRDLLQDYVHAYNRRVDLDQLEAQVAQLREERDHLRKELEIETGYRRSAMDTRQLLTDRASVAERCRVEAESREAQLRAALAQILQSAVPNEREHPAMWKAWREAEALLRASEGGV